MPITVRPLRADEGRLYLEIVNSAILGLAVSHYRSEAIEGWAVPINDETLSDLMRNDDHEIRLIAELDGEPVAIGALILERSELRACYVAPRAVRRGCGSALVRAIESLARENGLVRLELAGSLNAESLLCGSRLSGPRAKRGCSPQRSSNGRRLDGEASGDFGPGSAESYVICGSAGQVKRSRRGVCLGRGTVEPSVNGRQVTEHAASHHRERPSPARATRRSDVDFVRAQAGSLAARGVFCSDGRQVRRPRQTPRRTPVIRNRKPGLGIRRRIPNPQFLIPNFRIRYRCRP